MTDKYLKGSTIELVENGDLEGLKKLPKEELLGEAEYGGWTIAHHTAVTNKLSILQWLYDLSKTDSDFRSLLLAEDTCNLTIVDWASAGKHKAALDWIYEIAENDEDFKQLLNN